jgi:hypothetical protein
MGKLINTFNQGMDKDSSKNKYDNTHYFDAQNVRIITQEGLSSGALENMKGDLLRLNTVVSGNNYMVGQVVLRDWIILWTSTNNTSTPNDSSTDRIWKVPISSIESLATTNSLTLSASYFHTAPTTAHLIYEGNLYLCTGNKIRAIARYENDNIQKVYWVDGYNNLRHINTVYDADTNDLTSLSEDKLEVISNITLTQPRILGITDGNLRAGKIQYGYQLYSLYGAETTFSPLTNLIHLTSFSDLNSTSDGYKGSDIDDPTGKAVQGTITIEEPGYTRIRIIAVHYSSLNGEPEIRILDEKEIAGNINEVVYFTDTGTNLGNYTLEILRTLGTSIFSPKGLNTKDNILFPANITEDSFDVDFDARAYRFAGASGTSTEHNYQATSGLRETARVYEDDNSYFVIYAAGITRAGAGGTAAAGDWEYYNSLDVYQSGYAGYDQSGYGTAYGLPVTADAINRFNDLDNDGDHDYRFMYQEDGETLGGEGVNVKYEFKLTTQQLDIGSDNTPTAMEKLYSDKEGSVENPSYYGYASPFNVTKFLGYHRDEIYRFGVVFFDEKGRSSFVKWIGDIRFPSISTENKEDTYTEGAGYTAQEGEIEILQTCDDYEAFDPGTTSTKYEVNIDGETFDISDTYGSGASLSDIADLLAFEIDNASTIASASATGAVITVVCDKQSGSHTITTAGYKDSGSGWTGAAGLIDNYSQTVAYSAASAFQDFSPAFYSSVDDDIKMNILYLQFTISNLPSEAVNYQIVRVKRESNDRSVVAQGLTGHLALTGSDYHHSTWNTSTARDINMFVSPEVAFNKNLTRQANDKLQCVGQLTQHILADTADTVGIYKYREITALTDPQLPTGSSGAGDEHYTHMQTDMEDGAIVRQDQVSASIGAYNYIVNNATNHTDKGICFVNEVSNSSWVSRGTAYTARYLINYRRNIFSTQYGGNTYNARRRNLYIAASSIRKAQSITDVYGGDTFIGMFDHMYSSWEHESATSNKPEAIYFPVETSINLPLRNDECWHRIYADSGYPEFLHDSAGVWSDGSNYFSQSGDLYNYNTVYSKENDTKLFIAKPFDWEQQITFDNRILNSGVKTNNEISDSWLKFGANAYLDVDPQYGEITALQTINNQMLFFQPKAFGSLSINERALTTIQNVGQLVLGTSGVLERYDYAKLDIGVSDKDHIILTPNALYWIDIINKAMFKFTGGPEELSMMKGMDSWFRTNITTSVELMMYHDPEYREVNLVNHEADSEFNLVYNEVTDSFVGFTTQYPKFIINYNEKLLSSEDLLTFYKHNDPYGAKCVFYGASVSDPSYVTLLVNPDNENVAMFNNLEWLTEVSDGSSDLQETFTNITLYNDYQKSGNPSALILSSVNFVTSEPGAPTVGDMYINTTSGVSSGTAQAVLANYIYQWNGASWTEYHINAIPLVVSSNIKRRMRKWRFTIPRAKFEIDGITPLDRRDARFRDSHIFIKLEFANTNNRKFVAHDIVTSFMTSNK